MTATQQQAEPASAGIRESWSRSAPAVKAILVGTFVNKLGAFFQVFLVLFLTHRGFTGVQAGFALGCYGAGALTGVLTGGALADRLGPRGATVASMAGSAALLIAVLYVHAAPALLLAVGLVGLAGQLYRPAAATMLTELTPAERRVMTFALYRWALNLGTTAAPLLGAALIAVSYNLLFWAEALTAAAFAAIAAVALPHSAARPVLNDERSAGPRGYRAVLADRRYVRFLLATALNSLVYVQYVSTLPLAMRDAGLATFWFSAVVALNGFIVITFELPMTKLTQRWPLRRVLTLGFLLLGAGYSVYALPLGVAAFGIGTLVWTAAEITAGPSMFAYPGSVAPEDLRGRYVGAMQVMFSLGGVVGPALGVALYGQIGNAIWWCCGAICLVAAILAVSGVASDPQSKRSLISDSLRRYRRSGLHRTGVSGGLPRGRHCADSRT